uniref:Uncharacterized protein n=1 Tax=Oryza barthii TaxID=65489 RepID=A0A0D3HKI2_9ORYZ
MGTRVSQTIGTGVTVEVTVVFILLYPAVNPETAVTVKQTLMRTPCAVALISGSTNGTKPAAAASEKVLSKTSASQAAKISDHFGWTEIYEIS